jgi:hypothetical protein
MGLVRKTMLKSDLSVGIIQTSLDATAAWRQVAGHGWHEAVRMSASEERRARREIRHFIAAIQGLDRTPDIILLPELAVPLAHERSLVKAAEQIGAIIIAGMDYKISSSHAHPAVSNEAVIIVPRRLGGIQVSANADVRRIGKTYAAPGEAEKLSKIGVEFEPLPVVWLFESAQLGSFGVAVCYDFMDLDRISLYRNKIQTLFILAYNRDITSFDHIAEAIARMLFCNVVICNCGYFGGSVAVSPFREPFRRTVYRHSGQHLPTAQVVQLPLERLDKHQKGGNSTKEFKNLPPGFEHHATLMVQTEKI